MTTEPTDAEIADVARKAGLLPDNSHPAPETRATRRQTDAVQAFARAVLAKWGQPAPRGEPVAWLSPWRADQVTTDYDAYGEHGIPLYTAPQPVAQEPVAWKHDCAALLTNDVELWIDACPHCGKPRNAPPPVAREPLTDEQIERDRPMMVEPAAYAAGVRYAEKHHGIKGGQHG